MKTRVILRLVAIFAAIAAVRLALRRLSLLLHGRLNPTLAKPPYRFPAETARLHRTFVIADLHCDALLWATDLSRWNKTGHVDLPRLAAGNVALQVFSAVTKVPAPEHGSRFGSRLDLIAVLSQIELWPLGTWFSLTGRAVYQARKLRRLESRSHGKLTIITSRQGLSDTITRRASGDRTLAAILALEGAQAFSRDLAKINVLYDEGFRIVGLTHLSDNEVGGASTGVAQTGLTGYGRDVVKRLEELGMILDLAHASPALITDVLAIASRPVIVSHTGVQAICPRERNLRDDQIRTIVNRGGLIGIGYGSIFTCDAGIAPIARSIEYVAGLVGVDHVALGSDFDGAIEAPFDASGLPLLTQELKYRGFAEADIRKVMGGNVFRFLAENLP